jgi:hypothetical protein
VISTIAGTGTGSYSGDGGQATSAAVHNPHGIALDSSGNVFFNDLENHRVRKITVSTGIITTYAGTGASSYGGDGGVASSAAIYHNHGLCIDSAGGILYDSVIFLSYSTLPRQRVHRGLLQLSYSQGDGVNDYNFNDCGNGNGWL